MGFTTLKLGPSIWDWTLNGLLYGIFLSEILLAPYEALSENKDAQNRRILISGSAGGLILLLMLFTLCALGSGTGRYQRSEKSVSIEGFSSCFVKGSTEFCKNFKNEIDKIIPALQRLSKNNDIEITGYIPDKDLKVDLYIKRLQKFAKYLKSKNISFTDVYISPNKNLTELKDERIPEIKIDIQKKSEIIEYESAKISIPTD